jgi:hypothetical protein
VIIAVPAVIPVTAPEADPIEAIAVLLLLQVPPPAISESVVVKLWQTLKVPVMGLGKGFTVTAFIDAQPVAKV